MNELLKLCAVGVLIGIVRSAENLICRVSLKVEIIAGARLNGDAWSGDSIKGTYPVTAHVSFADTCYRGSTRGILHLPPDNNTTSQFQRI